jgi:hypothetical protein
VESVGTVVRRQSVFFAVERELSFGDAVGVAAGGGAEERVAGEILFEVVEAGDDVGGAARAIRDPMAALLREVEAKPTSSTRLWVKIYLTKKFN